MSKINYNVDIEVPKGISIVLDKCVVFVKGAKGEIKKVFENPRIEIKLEGGKIFIICRSEKTTLRDKRSINSIEAHIKNMFRGVAEGYHAKVKVCSGHFPMTASVEGNVVSIKNFLGEKVPRKTTMMPGVKAAVQGDIISVEGIDIEAVSQSAARIENMTRITDKDRRIFQDGCYIIEKPGNKKV